MTSENLSINPWAAQRQLMVISGQFMADPSRPGLSLPFFRYMAMILEELAETITATEEALQETPADYRMTLAQVALNQLVPRMHDAGKILRDLAASASGELPQTWTPPLRQLAQVLDGLTDLAVVVTGATITAGLPGPEAYAEVMLSNLSKADPRTGLIDVDPSGKWIKGPHYRAPDLERLLASPPPAQDELAFNPVTGTL